LTAIKTVCYLLNKLTLNESIENLVINDILERSENLKEMTSNNTVNNLLSKFIYYVKNIKVKIEDEDYVKTPDFKMEIKEEDSPNRKPSHFIIKKDDLSDDDNVNENDESNINETSKVSSEVNKDVTMTDTDVTTTTINEKASSELNKMADTSVTAINETSKTSSEVNNDVTMTDVDASTMNETSKASSKINKDITMVDTNDTN